MLSCTYEVVAIDVITRIYAAMTSNRRTMK